MPQVAIRAAFYRGGTSRAVMFREQDLAGFDENQRRSIILAALGSPDPYGREVDGLGGGISSLSKAAIVGPAPAGSDADVTFRFAQVDVTTPVVEFLGTCGNISAAVGPFAIDEGMVEPVEPITTVRVLSVNTGQRFLCHVPVRGGRAEVEGEYEIDGVPGRGARVVLEFLEPGGSLGRGVLPTGRAREELALEDGRRFAVSIVDAANPMVFVRARDLGATATEQPAEIDGTARLHATLEAVRDHAAARLGLASNPAEAHERARSIPKVVMVAPPSDYVSTRSSPVAAESVDLVARMLSVGKTHRTMAGTAAICTAVAAALPGTLVHEVARPSEPSQSATIRRDIRIGHPAGVLVVGATVTLRQGSERPDVASVSAITYRTARRIMAGEIYVPSRYLEGRAWFAHEANLLAGVR